MLSLLRRRLLKREQRGQSMVEFTLVIPVFLLLVFGIIQVALIYHAYSAVQQAATDAAHVTAAQGDKDVSNGAMYWQSDRAALAAARSALSTVNLKQITSLEIYAAGTGDTPITKTVTMSANAPEASTNVTFDNKYLGAMGTAGDTATCNVDGYFQLVNPVTSFSVCALPWNGQPYNPVKNQNGRNAVRCLEDRVDVRIAYQYQPLPFLPVFKITLVGQTSTSMEPTTFLKDASYTTGITSC